VSSVPRTEIETDQCRRRLLAGLRDRLLSFRKSGYDVLRLALGVLLLTTAGLKAYQLATEPVLGGTLLESRWFLIFVVEFELFFGLWLLSGLLAKSTWAAALGCFSLFTCVSLYKALSGHASCGCFGKVAVNPWITATFDFCLVFSLLYFRPRGQHSRFHIRLKPLPVRLAGVLAIWLSLAVPAALAIGVFAPTTLSDAGSIIGGGKIVVLEPEKWSGKRFPLLDYIDIGKRLKDDEWLVILYHHDCPACQKLLNNLDDTVNRMGCSLVALVEMPPYGGENNGSPRIEHFLWGRLDSSRDWFVEAPVAIKLDRGRVVGTELREASYD
jgi:hypothetical protein